VVCGGVVGVCGLIGWGVGRGLFVGVLCGVDRNYSDSC